MISWYFVIKSFDCECQEVLGISLKWIHVALFYQHIFHVCMSVHIFSPEQTRTDPVMHKLNNETFLKSNAQFFIVDNYRNKTLQFIKHSSTFSWHQIPGGTISIFYPSFIFHPSFFSKRKTIFFMYTSIFFEPSFIVDTSIFFSFLAAGRRPRQL